MGNLNNLKELVETLKPNYGSAGSRDVDVTAKRKAADELIERLEESEAELVGLRETFDDLAHAIGWSRERCEQTGESPKDVALSLVNLVSELEKDAFV